MPSRRRKRPSELQDHFAQAIRLGMPVRLACKAAGISESTYYEWVARGEGTHERRRTKEHVEFAEAIKSAELEGLQVLLARLRKAAEDPSRWQAAAWLLERRYPDQFARPAPRQEVSISGELSTRVTLDDTAKSAAAKLASILAKRSANGGDDEDPGDAEPG